MRLLLLLLLLPLLNLKAQPNSHSRYFTIAFMNAHTARPFGSFASLFYQEFHPGVEAGYGTILKNAKKHQFTAEVRMGYLYHRWIQHNIALSLNAGYDYKISSWSLGVKPGIGYQVSIADSKVFPVSEDPDDTKANGVRSQFIANLGFAVNKQINRHGMKIIVEYQQRLQAPFINEYVPILPYNNLFLGVTIPVR